MNNDQHTVSQLMERLRARALSLNGRYVGNDSTADSTPQNSSFEAITCSLPQEAQMRQSTDLDAVEAVPNSFKLSVDGKYRLDDLLKYHDREFIAVAYRAVLTRPPDHDGFTAYLNHLRNGMSKAEIIHILRSSSEGRTANVEITGLRSHILWSKLRTFPIAGSILVFSRALWRTEDLDAKSQSVEGRFFSALDAKSQSVEGRLFSALEYTIASAQQSMSAANAAITNLNAVTSGLAAQLAMRVSRDEMESMNISLLQGLVGIRSNLSVHDQALSKIDATLQRLSNTKADAASLDASMIEVKSGILSRLSADVGGLLEAIEALKSSKAEVSATEALHAEHSSLLQKLYGEVQAIGEAIKSVSDRNFELRRTARDQERRLLLLLEEARKRLPEPISPEQCRALVNEEDHVLDAMYASFEDRFRGTPEGIRAYQRDYLPYVIKAGAGTDQFPLVDLGCGRGEWLEVLRNEGLKARGIDTNRVFLDGCRELNLDVMEIDAVSFLRSAKPTSIGAITSFHLIEHLPRKALIALLDESIRVLKPGGVIILETPNPENLLVGAYKFYYDPTHIRPLPAESTRFLLESRGFVNLTTQDLHPDAHYASLISESPKLANHFSNGQDYMIVGWKA